MKEGELRKYSPALFAGWQRRNFRIEDGILQYFKGNQVQGTLNFDLYCCIVTQDATRKAEFTITFNGNDRSFQLKADT